MLTEELFDEWEEVPEDPEDIRPKDIHWYFALRAADEFFEANGRYPGSDGCDVDTDVKAVEGICAKLFQQHNVSAEPIPQVFQEM